MSLHGCEAAVVKRLRNVNLWYTYTDLPNIWIIGPISQPPGGGNVKIEGSGSIKNNETINSVS